MLEFDYPAVICLYISYVLLTVISVVNNFLPRFRKLSLPRTVPFGFILPPRITIATPLVRPVPYLHFSALCNRLLIAGRASAGYTWLSLLAHRIYDRELHRNNVTRNLNS